MIIISYIISNVNIPYNTLIIPSAGSSNDIAYAYRGNRVNCIVVKEIGVNLR